MNKIKRVSSWKYLYKLQYGQPQDSSWSREWQSQNYNCVIIPPSHEFLRVINELKEIDSLTRSKEKTKNVSIFNVLMNGLKYVCFLNGTSGN